eukprot:TRINITY_DN19050_c0_g1_i1.p1 TRINITY_DN19050_c0_g1~~TRINITY_DN19050_c0_g1_i1.p1  ORF type:complete len:101 (-),score=6.77 TRINITY_DN19050_c0_g1_i1:84-386(-)
MCVCPRHHPFKKFICRLVASGHCHALNTLPLKQTLRCLLHHDQQIHQTLSLLQRLPLMRRRGVSPPPEDDIVFALCSAYFGGSGVGGLMTSLMMSLRCER